MRRDVVVAAGLGAAVAASALVAAGAVRPDSYEVTATALSAADAISADSGGWTYSIPTDVAWRDGQGVFHGHGRPDCLPPSGEEEGPVRFTAVPVEVDGVEFRQVVFVECE